MMTGLVRAGLPHGFPQGLRVLVLEPEAAHATHIMGQLSHCKYSPTLVATPAQAVERLTSTIFDLILVDRDVLGERAGTACSAFLGAARSVPMVLMSSSMVSPSDVMVGIKHGAVDFLEKPLHPHKLQNIWQHVVRRKIHGGGALVAAAVRTSDTDLSAATVCGGIGGGVGGSKTCSLSLTTATTCNDSGHTAASTIQHDQCMATDADDSAPAGPIVTATVAAQGNGGAGVRGHAAASVGAAKPPAMGYPAGRLPPLTTPGVVWGLPTAPLRIMPRAPPWPMMQPPMMPQHPMMTTYGMPMMMMMMMTMMCAAYGMGWPGTPLGGARESSTAAHDPLKRCASVPSRLRATAGRNEPCSQRACHSISGVGEPREPSVDPALHAALADELRDGMQNGPRAAPIGLTLRRSASFLDLLQEGVPRPAADADMS